jgi:glutathione S-transferase
MASPENTQLVHRLDSRQTGVGKAKMDTAEHPMIELYHAHTSTCSQKVRLCLAEKGLDYVSRPVNLRQNEQLAPAYLAINPNGVVPSLVHDGQVILDSSVICEYLDEVFPQPRLGPDDAVGRAHMRKWLRFVEEVPTAAIRVPTFQLALTPYRSMEQEDFRANYADVRPLRKHFYRKMGAEGFASAEIDASLDHLDLTLRRMEAALANGHWLMGEDLTLADIVLVPTIDRLNDLGLADMWAIYPRVGAWYDRIKARPSFAASFYPGSRISESGVTIRPLERKKVADGGVSR